MVRIKTHPGEMLKEEFLVPLKMSATALAKELGIPANRITSIINGTRSVTADTAIKLGRYFKTTPQMWMNLQQGYDLAVAMAEEERLARKRRPAVRARAPSRAKPKREAA